MSAVLPHTLTLAPAWAQLREHFLYLAELPPPMRAAALHRLAGADAALARELRELLAQHEAEEAQGGDFLATPALLHAAPEAEPDRAGQRLGPWQLTQRLGHGGMGEVWEARRADGAYEARVAVKVLRGGADSAALLAHFAQEQRLLARLNHPHIARLLDAGRTPDQRPYFVLEAVDGQPIDAACRGRSLAGRLALFLQLADAVAHAHRQQLIHRDLKPANVLVTADDQVKLLDFGIAQAMDGAVASGGPRTLTPAYASPEQVRGEAVTTATDVYSLGVLLQVLLTGARPYGQAAVAMTTAHAALRAVLDEAPVPPSQAPVARGSDPGVPRAQLAGDVDAIAARALAKAPADRYPSVAALADDVRAFLDGRPVAARPHSAAYLAGKFLRRHRVAVAASALALLAVVAGLGATAWQARDAAAALALVALATGLGFSTWQARAAAAARDEARSRLAATSGLVRDIVMRYADTVTYLPGGLKMKGDLLKDTIAYLERLAAGAEGDALLAGERAKALSRLADVQVSGADATLDEPEDAARNAEQALLLFAQGEPAHRHDPLYYMWWARAMGTRQNTCRHAGELQAALDLSERERSLLAAVLPRFPGNRDLRQEHAGNLVGLGQISDTWMLASLNQPERALQAFNEAFALFTELHAEAPGDGSSAYQAGTSQGGLAIVHYKAGRLALAAEHGRQAVAWRETALAHSPSHVAFREGVAGEINNLARTLLELGLAEEALRACERAAALMRALEAEDPATALWAERRRFFAMHLGRALLALGRAAEAVPVLQESLLAMHAATGAVLRRRAWCELALAKALQAVGRGDEARAMAAVARADLQAFLASTPDDREALQLLAESQADLATPPVIDATITPESRQP